MSSELHDKIISLSPVDLLQYKEVIPEFHPLIDCIQDPIWHAEGDVLTHANMAMEEARKFFDQFDNDRERLYLYLGAMLHDFGKPVTTFKNEKGRIVAYGHESAGVSYANEFLKKYFPEFNYTEREQILSLVEFHGHPKRLINGKSHERRFKRLSFEVDTKLVYNLEKADFMGRTAKDKALSLPVFEAFKKQCEDLDIFGKYFSIPNSHTWGNLTYSAVRWQHLFHNLDLTNEKRIQKIDDLMWKMPPFELLLTIGAPASGKSTYISKLEGNFKVISMDEERKRLLGNPNDMSRNQEVYDNCFREFVKCMKQRQSVVWDATSATRKIRKRLIDVARSHGAFIGIVFFDLDLEMLQKRNEEREKTVPRLVVERFYRIMERPKPYEYDQLIVVDGSTNNEKSS